MIVDCTKLTLIGSKLILHELNLSLLLENPETNQLIVKTHLTYVITRHRLVYVFQVQQVSAYPGFPWLKLRRIFCLFARGNRNLQSA